VLPGDDRGLRESRPSRCRPTPLERKHRRISPETWPRRPPLPYGRFMPKHWLVGAVTLVCAPACEPLGQTGGSNGAMDASAPSETPLSADASVVGAGCGTETGSGTQLCVATSLCPNLVVDTQAMPHCGFRVRGGTADLVCGCGTAVCPMGVFTTCAEAAQLLTTQTEQAVCVQLAEGRCFESGTPSSPTAHSACDRTCLKECGGGAACASICNCS
jgi:hypothetical protein